MLDTCVCVQILRGRSAARDLPPVADCSLSSIVTAELRTGLAKAPPDAKRSAMLEEFIGIFEIISFDDACSREYADIRANLERRGISIGPLDMLIAAHARQSEAVLITTNMKEFRRVEKLSLLGWK